jgi:ABC-2 type transport system permease protein
MSVAVGFSPLYRRRLSISLRGPVALVGQMLTPVLWVLVVGPALAHTFGQFTTGVDYLSYVSLGQVVFVLPFSAMFAGLTAIFDRDWGILRELLVAPIRRSMIPLASTVAVLTVAAGQFVLIVGLAMARGARFHTNPPRLVIAVLAVGLLTAAVYGLGEFLAYTITQPQVFGTLIPAIGATPYALCGAIYPVAALPVVIRQVSWALPWTQCLDLLRYGLMGDSASGLREIWPFHNITVDALLSLAVLACYAAITQTLTHRRFAKTVTK